jgi:segregation and condensation protein B
MSLKAKLEAVIYAAEEPVTLAQLAALFTEEALEWKPELAEAPNADADAETEPAFNDEIDYPEPETAETDASENADAGVEESAEEPAPAADQNTPTPEAAAAAEADAKRLTRMREREARDVIRELLDELIAEYASDGRGIEIREIAGGYRLATKPEYHDAVRSFVRSLKPPLKLSLPALETLAVVAYKQPVTAPEVNEIRGVDSSAVFGSLLARKLIATAGRKQVIGRPILYKTTREFLLRFGLKDVTELPSMEEFEKMASVELDEPEIGSEAGDPAASKVDLNPALEFDENAAEEPTELPAVTAASNNPTNEAPEQDEFTGAEATPAVPSSK